MCNDSIGEGVGMELVNVVLDVNDYGNVFDVYLVFCDDRGEKHSTKLSLGRRDFLPDVMSKMRTSVD